MFPDWIQRPLTRREALEGGALAALWGVLHSPASALGGGSRSGDPADVRLPIPPRTFGAARDAAGNLVTRPIRAPRRLMALGVRWDAPDGPRLEVRTRHRGRWGRWVRLREVGEHGPDGRSMRRITDPVVLAGARVFQLRSDRIPAGLVALGVAGRRSHAAAGQNDASLRFPGAPPMTARAGWNAQPPRASPEFGSVELAFVHHTVSTNDYGPGESAAIVRAIQHYHREQLGWNDIGYQFLIDRYGQVFEGRAGGVDRAVIGAQAQGYNSTSTGVALIGTHTSDPLTPEAFEGLAAVLGWKLSLHGVPTSGTVTVTSAGGPENRYPAGRRVTLERISGHRDGDATACPGEALYAQLPALRPRAGELAGGRRFSLSVTPRRVEQLATAIVSGHLSLPDGSPVHGVAVEIQARTSRGWQPLTSAVTDAHGAYSGVVALPHTRTLRAVAVDAAGASHVSEQALLEVRSAIVARARPVRVRYGGRVLLRGRVKPSRPRRRVIVTVARRAASGRYRRVARFAAEARDGRLRVPLYPSRPGLYRVRVSVPADRLNVAARSPDVFVRAVR